MSKATAPGILAALPAVRVMRQLIPAPAGFLMVCLIHRVAAQTVVVVVVAAAVVTSMKILIPIILAVLLLPFFIWLFYMIHKESKKLTIKTFRDLERETIPDLKCPKCSTYMEVGYTVAGKGMMFRNRNEKFRIVALDRLLPNTANLGFSIKENLS